MPKDTTVVSDNINGKEEKKTSLVSRNITVLGHRTSVRLEPEMWSSLHDIARREKCTIHDICSLVSLRKKPETSLTAAIRVFLMLYFRAAATEEGHKRAGHGDFEYMRHRARLNGQVINGFARKKSHISRLPGKNEGRPQEKHACQ